MSIWRKILFKGFISQKALSLKGAFGVPFRERPADKIIEGLNEALSVAKGESIPYAIHAPNQKHKGE